MTIPALQRQMTQVTRRARRWEILAGVGRCAGIALATALLAGATDYLLGIKDTGLRVLLSTLVAIVWLFSCRRYLWPVVARRVDELQLAKQVERLYPELRERLASSLEFLQAPADDYRSGSFALRSRVIAQTTDVAATLDLRKAVDIRDGVQAAAAASVITLIVVGLALGAPTVVSRGAQRLAAPWRDLPWPRSTHLRFVTAPQILAAGSDFEVVVEDANGRVLTEVLVEYAFDDDPGRVDSQPMRSRGTQWVHRRENVTQPFRYRVSAGDDDTCSWRQLQVVEPPRLEQSGLRIVPPQYTGWPIEDRQPPLRVLAGSRIELTARVSRPVSAAHLRTVEPVVSGTVPVQIDTSGRQLAVTAQQSKPWLAEKSATYALDVDDADGLRAELARWILEVLPDAPPTVHWTHPADESIALPKGRVLTRGVAQDDVRVEKLVLRYRLADSPDREWLEVPLDAQPSAAGAAEKSSTEPRRPAKGNSSLSGNGDRRPWEWSWDLATVPGVVVGSTWELQIGATDALGQIGLTEPRRLRIVSEGEILEQWARRQSSLAAMLQDALTQQRAARDQTQRVIESFSDASAQAQHQADLVQSIDLQERQVARLLGNDPGGVQQLVVELQTEIRANALQASEFGERLERIHERAAFLVAEPLAGLQRTLQTGLKALRSAPREAPPERGALESLRQARTAQDIVVKELEQLLADQQPWETYRRLHRELDQLRQEETDLLRRTNEQLEAFTSRNSNSPNPNDEAATRNLANRQLELARQLERLVGQLEQLRENWTGADPATANALRDTLAAADERTAEGLLQEAGRALQRARLGEAIGQQKQAVDALGEMLDRIAQRGGASGAKGNTREAESAQAQQDLARWLKAITELVAGQNSVVQRTVTATTPGAPGSGRPAAKGKPKKTEPKWEALAQDQQDLADEAQSNLRDLPPLPGLLFALRPAAEQMGQAADALRRREGDRALPLAREALHRLEIILEALQDQAPEEEPPPEAEPPEPNEKPSNKPAPPLAASRTELLLLRNLQVDLRERTAGIERLRAADGALPPDRQKELKGLAEEQGRLAEFLFRLVREAQEKSAEEGAKRNPPNDKPEASR